MERTIFKGIIGQSIECGYFPIIFLKCCALYISSFLPSQWFVAVSSLPWHSVDGGTFVCYTYIISLLFVLVFIPKWGWARSSAPTQKLATYKVTE
jgi:hypothetical protein